MLTVTPHDLEIGTPMADLQEAWCYWGQTLGLVVLVTVHRDWVRYKKSLICIFYLTVAARTIVEAKPFLRYTCMLLGTDVFEVTVMFF